MKPPLAYDELRDVIDLSLWAGQMLLQHGAASQRVEETIHHTALVSAVLLLVPGVPLINAADDLLKGHLIMGIARGVTGLIISLAIALGLLLAMRLLGVSGL